MTKSVDTSYPTLAEMGVESLMQIENYYMSSINQVDILRIVYDRPKDSFLSSSRTYKFPRVPDSASDKVAGKGEAAVLRTHPRLVAALDELQMILRAKSSKESIAASLLSEIEQLEEDIAMRTECLKLLVGKIPLVK